MKYFAILAVSLCLLIPCTAVAQDEEQAENYTYATYFYCDTSTEDSTDTYAKETMAPAYNAALEAGEITSWGWLSHHTGGKWRRIQYHGAPSVAALLSAQETISARFDDEDAGIGASCKSHDDYIWKGEASSGGTERGPAGMSVYFVCTMTREERADELVNTLFAPLYNKAVADGQLASWGWLSHIMGGKYRRLLTMTGADHGSLMAARGSILNAMDELEGADEFTEICGSHSDYLWNIEIENP